MSPVTKASNDPAGQPRRIGFPSGPGPRHPSNQRRLAGSIPRGSSGDRVIKVFVAPETPLDGFHRTGSHNGETTKSALRFQIPHERLSPTRCRALSNRSHLAVGLAWLTRQPRREESSACLTGVRWGRASLRGIAAQPDARHRSIARASSIAGCPVPGDISSAYCGISDNCASTTSSSEAAEEFVLNLAWLEPENTFLIYERRLSPAD